MTAENPAGAAGRAAARSAAAVAGTAAQTQVGAQAVDAQVVDAEIVDTVIVGSGFAGLGLAIRLEREAAGTAAAAAAAAAGTAAAAAAGTAAVAGTAAATAATGTAASTAARPDLGSYVVLERGDDVGGTWRDNTYPGVGCDIPSHLYSFSFRPKADWSRFFAPGAEILDYLREAARDEGVLEHTRFGAEVLDARWDAAAQRWDVRTVAARWRSRHLVIATGRLSEPRIPIVSGVSGFAGEAFHSSQWPADLDLAGKRVGVVGTGASAVQLLPRVAGEAAEVVVFQRSAPYVVPRGDRAYTTAEQQAFAADDAVREVLRTRLFWDMEAGFAARLKSAAPMAALEAAARDHREAQVSDPALRRSVTPDYEIGCKRVLLSDDYYPALTRSSVRLEPSGVAAVEGAVVTAESGASYELDVLVWATGFLSTRPPIALRVRGRDGLLLADAWREGMVAHRSTTVAGFPNLFVIDGPNASLGHNSAVHMIETQITLVLDALVALAAHRLAGAARSATLEPRASAQAASVADVDRRAATTVWTTGGCTSWYVDERSRRLALVWPDTASAFRDEARFDAGEYVFG